MITMGTANNAFSVTRVLLVYDVCQTAGSGFTARHSRRSSCGGLQGLKNSPISVSIHPANGKRLRKCL